MGLAGSRAGAVAVPVDMTTKASGGVSGALLSSGRSGSSNTMKKEDAEETWLVGDESSSSLSVGRLGSLGALQRDS